MAHSDRLQLQLQLCPVSSRFCYYFYITCENNNRAARGEGEEEEQRTNKYAGERQLDKHKCESADCEGAAAA